MKKSFMTLALCGLALAFAGVASASDNSGWQSDLPQDKMLHPWEVNLQENVAAQAVLNQQATGIEYGTSMLGAIDGR